MRSSSPQAARTDRKREVGEIPQGSSQKSDYLIVYEMGHVSQDSGLLCEEAAPDKGYLELETDVGLKSRMRENRTYGSVRGSRQAIHTAKYLERSVELVYSTESND